MQIKPAPRGHANHRAMAARFIPIVPAAAAARCWQLPHVSGDPCGRVQSVLEAAVSGSLGLLAGHWLRELHLIDDEAWVAVAPGLGHDGVQSAGIAFETLRRLLPDTDIYVGAAQS